MWKCMWHYVNWAVLLSFSTIKIGNNRQLVVKATSVQFQPHLFDMTKIVHNLV